MNLRHLTDKVLLQDIKQFVSQEREATTAILHHLKEIERRKLFSDLGFSSLFAYCTKHLGYSESSAQRRIQAARLLAELPEIEKKIESGELSLTNIAQAQTFFAQNTMTSPEEKKKVLEKVENLSKRECEDKLFNLSGKVIKEPKDTRKRISNNSHKITITVTDETLDKLEYLKNLLGKNPTMNDLIKLMAEETIKVKEKQKFKLTDKPRVFIKKSESPEENKEPNPKDSKVSLPPVNISRSIPASLKRQVFTRDKSCRICHTTHNLNFDHIRPFSLGGTTTKENLRLLCSSCNQRARIRAKL